MDRLLPGIYAERVPTSRLTVNVLAVAGRDGGEGPPVLTKDHEPYPAAASSLR